MYIGVVRKEEGLEVLTMRVHVKIFHPLPLRQISLTDEKRP